MARPEYTPQLTAKHVKKYLLEEPISRATRVKRINQIETFILNSTVQKIVFQAKMKCCKIREHFSFGKYLGKKIGDCKDISYLDWLCKG